MDRRKFVQLAGALGSQLAWPAFAGGVGQAATSGHDSGSIGKVSRRQDFHSGRISCGCASDAKCPMAHVTT